MDGGQIRRAVLNIRGAGEEGGLRVDILRDSRVRLRLLSLNVVPD